MQQQVVMTGTYNGKHNNFKAGKARLPLSNPKTNVPAKSEPGNILQGLDIEGRYRIRHVIGKGAAGVVHLADDLQENRQVAVKSYTREGINIDTEKIIYEAQILAGINHENIVRVEGAGIFRRKPFVVMEHLEGKDLDERLDGFGPMALDEFKRVVLQLCVGLGVLHNADIIHGDVKPSNILLTPDELAKIIDFDISIFNFKKVFEEVENKSGLIEGTPHYMAPESIIIGRKRDARVDIYALGIVMYRMLTNVLPFEGSTFRIFDQQISCDPELPSRIKPKANIPKRVEDVVMRAMEKNPDRRFPSMDEMYAAVNASC